MRATNPTRGPIYANGIVGADGQMRNFEILPGDSVDVDERSAMILGEYGAIVERVPLDDALAANDDPRVEPVVSPFAHHGPGTTDRGNVIDEDAASGFSEAVSGDTSKTPAQVAGLATVGAVAAPAGQDAETVTSAGGSARGRARKTAEAGQ